VATPTGGSSCDGTARGFLLIGGSRLDDGSAGVRETHDPGSGKPVGVVPQGSVSDVGRAVDAAREARAGWRHTPAGSRGDVLARAAAALEADIGAWAELMTREMGKPLAEAKVECVRAARILRFFAGEAHRPFGEHYESDLPGTWLFTRREPVGVVGLITPWNFPAAIPAWKLAPALVFGNAVVLKLASDGALTGLRLVEALADAGLPDGVLNVVLGPGAEIGAAIAADEGIDAVSFTGSMEVGRGIRDEVASRGGRVQLELGGHNPVIIRADADLELALGAVTLGAFASAGQKCTATRRVYVAESLYGEFVDALAKCADALRVGHGLDPDTQLGPLVSEGALEEVLTALERASSDGEVRAGGVRRADGDLARGAYMDATVVTDLTEDAELATREVFGPAVSVWPAADDHEAIELANRLPYGLSAALFTADLGVAMDFVEEIEVGLVHVNSQTAGADPHVPFGGAGSSAYGPHEQGRAAIEFFTEQKTVYMDRPEGNYSPGRIRRVQ
jgi:acyl-CoA reductase-like NAD-dependent aldehyde dehydrogenase